MDENQASAKCDGRAISAYSGSSEIMKDLNKPWMFVMSRKYANRVDDCILDDRPGTEDKHSDERIIYTCKQIYVFVNLVLLFRTK